ncbi:hypothetical protein K504DRAFT_274313 [Pleomassaria siparia CBS 279.74]|uniref:Uncharacterized protein n=1 Tax=Pleomassaria siparia CBS 279.74 TaxID=1314801 RepID=A0A6G1K9G0_9PLEO|nr:hypothetical protein K504DRAFT_274313 [Pleomassaria siparia CBS 279.74]
MSLHSHAAKGRPSNQATKQPSNQAQGTKKPHEPADTDMEPPPALVLVPCPAHVPSIHVPSTSPVRVPRPRPPSTSLVQCWDFPTSHLHILCMYASPAARCPLPVACRLSLVACRLSLVPRRSSLVVCRLPSFIHTKIPQPSLLTISRLHPSSDGRESAQKRGSACSPADLDVLLSQHATPFPDPPSQTLSIFAHIPSRIIQDSKRKPHRINA